MHIGGIFGSAAALALVVAIAPPAHATTATAAEVSAVSSAGKGAPEVGAKEAYLVDSAGTIHLGKRQTRKVPVASLVKVMTAYVVLREARLTDTITIKQADVKHALDNGATTAALKKGEKMTVRDLLYGLMLPSGADAANALARTYGPGNKAFVAKMNAAAKTLGLASTRYTNADGLPSPARGGYSTAADQAKLALVTLEDEAFRTVVSRKVYKVAKSAAHRAHTWRNTNKLLGREGVLGVKTGYTNAAGFCLLFAADRGGRRVVGVLLGDQNERRFTEAEQMLEYAESQILAG
ncbi:serine hydrolase [Nonomuraea sp. NBC_01738]|uniref:D-alanyl-D-alanine carboxypeptidase family protein n=1 Tax=Nonomuraea sp. NBC_01738 TaxID=2976003 RepID=UPI002E14CD95|nr:serine hydrolase [Nonomuraea sp. NBC_01738]